MTPGKRIVRLSVGSILLIACGAGAIGVLLFSNGGSEGHTADAIVYVALSSLAFAGALMLWNAWHWR